MSTHMSVEHWAIVLLIACLLGAGWRSRQDQRRINDLEADRVELDAELRLAERKLRRAEDPVKRYIGP